jgi:uncharacterized membrane protein YdfJ with MMPL/SSD domain
MSTEGVAVQAAAALHPRHPDGSASRLYRWGLLVARRRRVVFVIWLLLAAAALGFVPRLSSSLSIGSGLWVTATSVDLKELGFALAAVVLIDAAITRRLLVPAALCLLAGRAWTWPADIPPVRTRDRDKRCRK